MPRKFWAFEGAADGVGELKLYGPIGPDDGMGWLFDEISPKQFRQDLDDLGDVSEIKVLINSEGGDVFAGQAIHSMLVRHPAHVTTYIDGLAASIASIVAVAGDTVVMPRNAMMMIHDPWTVGIGNAIEFRKLASTLDSIRESMIGAYQSKTSIDRTKLISMLNAETWLTADEAVELGFADQVEESKRVAASLLRPGIVAVNGREFNLERFHNLPDQWDAGAEGSPTKRDAERALRDAGFSRDKARAVVSRGWLDTKPEPERDAPQVEVAAPSVAEQLRLRSESERLISRVRREYAGVNQ